MKYIFTLVVFVLMLLVYSGGVYAQSKDLIYSPVTPTPNVEYALPFPGILPDHPMYFIKTFRDKILLFFTRDPIKKINITLLISDKNLVMGQILWEKGNIDLSLSTFVQAEKHLLNTALEIANLKKQDKLPPGLADKVELAAKKHEELISKLSESQSGDLQKQMFDQATGINHQATQQIILSK